MNQYNPHIHHIHHRRSIRLKGYDYSKSGLYFITICVQNRECLFGSVETAIETPVTSPVTSPVGAPLVGALPFPKMLLNDAGKMLETEWLNLKTRFPNIVLHEFIVMPNHFHGILEIDERNFEEEGQPQGFAPTVGDMVGAFQSIVTVKYINGLKTLGWQSFNGKLFQRNYYEHIIRNEKSYQNISKYIINNPSKWNDDKFNKNV